MQTPAGRPQRPANGSMYGAVLGSLTIEGHPGQVRVARAFVARTLSAAHVPVDGDAATLLTSEIVTNAITHTRSGSPGGTVTIVVIQVPRGLLVEVMDQGAPGVPVVKGDLFAAAGHGLYLVQQLAAQWGYLREPSGTLVWFHLPLAGERADDTAASGGRQSAAARTLSAPHARGGPPAFPWIASATAFATEGAAGLCGTM